MPTGFARSQASPQQDPLAGIKDLAKQVAAAGIRHITGDVLIDDRLFVQAKAPAAARNVITPIMVNDNVLDFTFEPTEPGQPAKATWRPQTSLFKVEFDVKTVKEERAAGNLDSPAGRRPHPRHRQDPRQQDASRPHL